MLHRAITEELVLKSLVESEAQSLCSRYAFSWQVRHKSSTLFQFKIARDRGPEALGAIHL